MLLKLFIPILAIVGALATPAVADSVRPSAELRSTAAATDAAAAAVGQAQVELAQWEAAKRKLDATYKSQLQGIDKLKRQRSSWGRDRQLRRAYAESQSTAKKLADYDRRARSAATRLRSAREALLEQIEAELARSPAASRQSWLTRLRAAHRPSEVPRRRIVLPDERIDPLASAAELEEQAQLLAKSEAQLAREIDNLDRREKRYLRMAKLRQTRARAAEMSLIDDESPRRTTGHTGRGSAATVGGSAESGADNDAPSPAPGGSVPPAEPSTGGTSFDRGASSDFSIILADVVDTPTLNAYRVADMSGDPSKKAAAAKRMRDQAAKRLERLRRQRQQMLDRARQQR